MSSTKRENVILIDWVSITSKIHTPEEIIDLLGMSECNWQSLHGAHGYMERLYYDSIYDNEVTLIDGEVFYFGELLSEYELWVEYGEYGESPGEATIKFTFVGMEYSSSDSGSG